MLNITEENENSEVKLEKFNRVVLIIGIIIMIPFIIYVLNRTDEPYIIFGILNEDNEMGNYTTEVQVGENVSLYFFVENYGFHNLEVQMRKIVGDNESLILTPNGSSGGSLEKTYATTLNDGERWNSVEVNTSFSSISDLNTHEIIAFELWINNGTNFIFYDINFIRIRVA